MSTRTPEGGVGSNRRRVCWSVRKELDSARCRGEPAGGVRNPENRCAQTGNGATETSPEREKKTSAEKAEMGRHRVVGDRTAERVMCVKRGSSPEGRLTRGSRQSPRSSEEAP